LSRLPRPKNDYEIVLPDVLDSVGDDERMDVSTGNDEDQADIDHRRREDKRRKGRPMSMRVAVDVTCRVD
jgi:hypothetical protein